MIMKANRKKLLIIVSIIILALIVIGAVAWSYVFRKSETSVAGQKATVEITASLLVKAYEMNEDSANIKYNDRVISVEGVIAEVQESDINIAVYLKEKSGISGVMCSFDKEAAKKEDFGIGRLVKIKGICNGYLMDVVLNKCVIEND